MSHSVQPFSLQKLIKGVDKPNIIEEQLTLYKDDLDANQQFIPSVLSPLLTMRITAVNTSYAPTLKAYSNTVVFMNTILVEILEAAANSASIFTISQASDYGSKLNEIVKETNGAMKGFAMETSKHFKEIVDAYFKLTSNVDFKSMVEQHKLIDKMIHDGTATEPWIIDKVMEMNKELAADVGYMSTATMQKTAFLIHNELNKVVVTSETMNVQIVKAKAKNALISDEMVDLANTLVLDLKKIQEDFSSWINMIYVQANFTQETLDSIKVYQELSSKINLSD